MFLWGPVDFVWYALPKKGSDKLEFFFQYYALLKFKPYKDQSLFYENFHAFEAAHSTASERSNGRRNAKLIKMKKGF